jgi:hypothetical protein
MESTFNSDNIKVIRVGRSKKAEVECKDESISRIQCTIVYEQDNWVLYDGNFQGTSKISTNGIW